MDYTYAPILQSVLSAASSAFTEEGRPPGRVELTPGLLPAWDDCCKGQLYLRVMEVFPSSPFPTFDTSQQGANLQCAIKMLDLHIGLGIIRCAATVADDTTPPTPEQVSADGVLMLNDMQTLLSVILCTVPTLPRIQKVKLDRWIPQGVQGGCGGGEWGVHLAVDPCVVCP